MIGSLGREKSDMHCYNENRFSSLPHPSAVLLSYNGESLNSDAPSGGISNQGYKTKYSTRTYHLATPNLPLHLLHSAPFWQLSRHRAVGNHGSLKWGLERWRLRQEAECGATGSTAPDITSFARFTTIPLLAPGGLHWGAGWPRKGLWAVTVIYTGQSVRHRPPTAPGPPKFGQVSWSGLGWPSGFNPTHHLFPAINVASRP